ncbi:MAG: hypothetical protein ACOCW6_09325 [Spirochaetota bacterium]
MKWIILPFLVLLPMVVLAISTGDAEYPRETEPDQYFDVSKYDDTWITSDRDEDGRIDYALRLTEELQKDREAVDFNYDGMMDDFYFYENDVLVRQEVDTNFDGKIDLWVFLDRGVYVERYERDTDFDGMPDVIKEYVTE